MKLILLVFQICLAVWQLSAQPFFPIKVNQRWGLIDSEGKVVLSPVYEAIGEFKQFGYAVMQRNGGVGLLDRRGKEIVAPRYEDLRILDSTLIEVRHQGEWLVIGMDGQTVLDKGYQRVRVWNDHYVAYRKEDKWGLIQKNRQMVAPPVFDEISYEAGQYFVTRKGESLGLLHASGREIIPNIAGEISIFSDSLFFYKKGNFWGAVDQRGQERIPAQFESFNPVSDGFIKLVGEKELSLFSISCGKVISTGEYENFFAFSRRMVLVKRKKHLGLLDACGRKVLSSKYTEIQAFEDGLFRASEQGKWGIVGLEDQQVLPFRYSYIAPPQGPVCLVKQGRSFGVINVQGEEVVAPVYQRIELTAGRAKAYRADDNGQESLSVLFFDDQGRVKGNSQFEQHIQVRLSGRRPAATPAADEYNPYLLENFEWFYSTEADRWGLRRLNDGEIQIDPVFHSIKTDRRLGFTLVGMEKSDRFEFERTTYRFDMSYGLVRNDVGLLVTEMEFWDVRFEDFRQGAVARCVFNNGRHGLIDRIGRIIRRDFAFIGEFHDGVARMSVQGKLSGSMKDDHALSKLREYLRGLESTANLVDYTHYDQLFRAEASLVCEDCQWGYIDTSGNIVVNNSFSFARDFVNGVGIVECNSKWGMVDRKGKELIPCRYDGVQFLENTGNRMVRVYIREPKYGLIDTLGQIAVNAIYNQIGSFSEGRLAVQRNGLWGFVDQNGLEVIPCRFREVQNFSEGLAAVKLGRYWGFINKQGEELIPFEFVRAGNFSDGLAWVYTGDRSGYINRARQYVIPPRFDRAHDFHQGVARVMIDNQYGLIDNRGRWVQRPRFADIGPFNRHNLAVATYGNANIRYGLINLKGELISAQSYREIGPFSDGLAPVKDNNGYGFIDTTGRLVIPCIYSKVSGFSEGRAAVQRGGACGYITQKGREIVNFEFSKCLDFDGGKAVVYRGIRRAGLVDLEGKLVLEPSVDRLLTFREGRGLVRDDDYRFYYITEQADLYNGFYQDAGAFYHGVAVVQVNGKWGIINQRGIELIPPKYDRIESFEGGFAKVRIMGFNGLSNLRGELIVQPNYEYISYAGEGLFRVEQGDKIGYFDTQGNWVWDLSK